MAIVSNFWLKGSKKRLAGAVIYQAMGQTRQRALAAEVSNPRTEAQMNQRVKWANLVNLYRANQSWMKYAFETKKSNQSEYNKWMSLNVTGSRIYLPKEIAAAGGAVVDAYQVTQGSLPSIEWSDGGGSLLSNIFLPVDFVFTSVTTIGAFSQALVAENPAIRIGDQLSFIRMTQLLNAYTGAPYVQVREYEFIVDTTSTALLSSYWPMDLFEERLIEGINRLEFVGSSKSGGFAMILSRTIAGRTYVSSQSIVVWNNDTIVNRFSNAEALQAAIDSYGSSTDAFLSTVSAAPSNNIPTDLSLLAMILDGTTYTGGEVSYTMDELDGTRTTLVFNGAIYNILPGYAYIVGTNGQRFASIEMESSPNSDRVDIMWPGPGLAGNSDNVDYISITIQGLEYRFRFAIPAPDGGME